MHKLLERLVVRYLKNYVKPSELQKFISAVSEDYERHDEDIKALQRTILVTANELDELRQAKVEQQAAAQQKMTQHLALQKALLDATPEAVLSFSANGRISQINRKGLALMGISERDVYANSGKKNLSVWLQKLSAPDSFLSDLARIDKDRRLELRGEVRLKDGRYFEYSSVPEILDGNYLGRVWCWRDISKMRAHQDELRYQAFHDALTSLPNRLLLIESLGHAIDLAKRNDHRVAVMFLDFDDFKKINDTAGHLVGDQFLVDISKRIQKGIREGDIFGRLGGDEFLIVLEGIRHQYEIRNVKEKILELLSEPIVVQQNHYVVSCSMGISLFPADGDKPEELVRKADMAMYQAKKSGKNTFRYFDPGLERVALHRLSIENKLREGIKHQEFSLVFQPKVRLHDGAMQGVEALIRWVRPDGELVYPDQFISVAENIGLIRPITHWVIGEACQKLHAWRGTAMEGVSISVNISAMDLRDESFYRYVKNTIDHYGIDASLLELELTESVFLEEKLKAQKIISRLKSMQLRLSVDDFGTGYSSFSYLQELDIDYLKIDRSFVENADKNARSAAIVKSIIDVGTNLGMQVVAEGVETSGELQLVESAGCHLCQGYCFSTPLTEHELMRWSEGLVKRLQQPLLK